MRLSVDQCLTAIETHTRGLAAAAETDLTARVEHCGDWSMADLVWHVIGVHRFWNGVAAELPADEPGEVPEHDRPEDDALIGELLAGMETMVATLRTADQDAPCWTWGLEQNVRFITRHQVQEAAVHHWDAVNAGQDAAPWTIESLVAADAVDELLTHSLPHSRWPSSDTEPLGGSIWFCADDGEAAETWLIVDGEQPGTLGYRHSGSDPEVTGLSVGGHGSAADLLLWLYDRIENPCVDGRWNGDTGLLDRLRAIAD